MRVKQSTYYRRVGIREQTQIAKPRLIPMQQFTLPTHAIYHFMPEDTAVRGPNPQDPLYLSVDGRNFIRHITELKSHEGNPRRTAAMPTTLLDEFRRKTRGFRPLHRPEALTLEAKNVLTVNYAMLTELYRYTVSTKASYFRWFNQANTLWRTVDELDDEFKWNQYIELAIPDQLPGVDQFIQAGNSPTSDRIIKTFSSPGLFDLLDLWLWLGERRELSTISQVNDVSHVNFLFRIRGYFFVLNLGLLDQWRRDPEDKTDTGTGHFMLQQKIHRLFQACADFARGDTTAQQDDSIAATASKDVTPLPPSKEALALPDLDDLRLELPDPKPVAPEDLPVNVVDPELPTLTDKGVDVTEEPPALSEPTLTPFERLTEGVHQRADEMLEMGLLTVKAHERIVREGESFKDIPDPFGSGKTVGELLTIDPKELSFDEGETFLDRDTVLDKSMLRSSTRQLQKEYLNRVYQKDVLNAVMGVQQLGVTVKNYQIETVRDSMNHFQIHTVTLKPVRGKQSTVRFRLPVIDEDGRFISNGQQCKMRLQRVDVPIRKVSPRRVALTSDYNKTFVERSERSTNNFERWLQSEIVKRGQDDENSDITNLRLGNAFDPSLEIPRVYSMLSQRIVSFTAGEYHFVFNYPKRHELIQKAIGVDVAPLESETTIAIGYHGKTPILVDINDTLYEGETVLGTLPDVLGFDISRAPIDIAEMSVTNKSIPLGFVLAYHIGLTDLIKQLNASVVRYRRGERFTLQPDEYTLTFQDEVLVFTRQDQRATMVLAGLRRYHQSLTDYSVWDFDRKDVYLNVLANMGMGVRFLREIDTLFQVWVDPITRSILEQMGEPTEFYPLLLRAVDLLKTNYSPVEVDGAFMRYRGYERFPGMVYGELVRAAKQFNARPGAGDRGIEMNPHLIWQKIVQDPSVALVEDANPIQNLREQEVMTYRGSGGRSGTSMRVERTRVYTDADVGVVSESTLDSGDVGVVAYLSPDANFNSLRGTTRRFNKETDGTAKLISSSALNAPCVDGDDAKRIKY